MNHLSQHSACQQKPIRSPRETHSSESQLEYLSLLFCCIWQPNSTVGNRFHRWLSWAAAICDPLVSVLVIMCKNTENCLTGSNQWATSPSILLPTMARQMPAGSWAEKVQKSPCHFPSILRKIVSKHENSCSRWRAFLFKTLKHFSSKATVAYWGGTSGH